MHKLEFTLRQHTPLIHFQHIQDGATLRATEVKPKLDRFLIDKLKKNNQFDERWLLGDESKASLDYKLFIYPHDDSHEENIGIELYNAGNRNRKAIPLVLANMGVQARDRKYKRLVLYGNSKNTGEILIEIFSFHNDLLNRIKEHFADFIFRNNFGNRQTKGFGAFYVHENDEIFKNPSSKYWFSVDLSQQASNEEKIKRVFEHIHLLWKAFRSGLNDGCRDKNTQEFKTTFYFKSLIFAYAKSKNIQWEKKTIKNHIFMDKLEEQKERKKNIVRSPNRQISDKEFNKEFPLFFESSTKYLMKDMLGLASEEEWIAEYDDKLIKKHVKKSENDSETVWIVPKEDEKIERYPSPVTFKPIFDENKNICKIFIFIKPMPQEMREQWFEIRNNAGDKLQLQIPKSEVANLTDFFLFLFDKQNGKYHFDLPNHVENLYKTPFDRGKRKNVDHPKRIVINRIINEIRSNYNK